MKWVTTDWKGIVLGIGFTVLGILTIGYPELAASRPSNIGFERLMGSLLFLAGLAQILYIGYKKRRR